MLAAGRRTLLGKTCSACELFLPAAEFGRRKDGYTNGECIPCTKAGQKKYMAQYRILNDPSYRYHGMTDLQFVDMWLDQDGRCALCFAGLTPHVKNTHIDHDHACCPGTYSCGRCVRGILCGACNRAVGTVERIGPNFPEWLERATRYLQRGTEQRC